MTSVMILRNAGYPDDPAMHGLIAGLWSSLSGLGRFMSRVGSGMLVDFMGFNPTAVVVCVLQLIIVRTSKTFQCLLSIFFQFKGSPDLCLPGVLRVLSQSPHPKVDTSS